MKKLIPTLALSAGCAALGLLHFGILRHDSRDSVTFVKSLMDNLSDLSYGFDRQLRIDDTITSLKEDIELANCRHSGLCYDLYREQIALRVRLEAIGLPVYQDANELQAICLREGRWSDLRFHESEANEGQIASFLGATPVFEWTEFGGDYSACIYALADTRITRGPDFHQRLKTWRDQLLVFRREKRLPKFEAMLQPELVPVPQEQQSQIDVGLALLIDVFSDEIQGTTGQSPWLLDTFVIRFRQQHPEATLQEIREMINLFLLVTREHPESTVL